jgi:hypothetical protein
MQRKLSYLMSSVVQCFTAACRFVCRANLESAMLSVLVCTSALLGPTLAPVHKPVSSRVDGRRPSSLFFVFPPSVSIHQ